MSMMVLQSITRATRSEEMIFMAWRVWSRFPSKCHNYLGTSGTTLTVMRRVPSLHKCSNVHTSPTHLCKQIEPNHTAYKPNNTRQILRSKPPSSRYSYTSEESRRPPGIIHNKHSSRCSASHTSSALSLPSPPVSLPAATQHRNGCWLPGTSLLSLATNWLVLNFTTPPPSARMSLSLAMVSGMALWIQITSKVRHYHPSRPTISLLNVFTGAFCDQIGWDQGDSYDWETIKQNIKFFNTNTFVSQLLYAFDPSRLRKSHNSRMRSQIIDARPWRHIVVNPQQTQD